LHYFEHNPSLTSSQWNAMVCTTSLRSKDVASGRNSVLPRGRNFGRKAQKGPKKIWQGRKCQGPNFCTIYQKGAELFFGLVLQQIIQ
jgi:hypothetical protein